MEERRAVERLKGGDIGGLEPHAERYSLTVTEIHGCPEDDTLIEGAH